MRKTKQAHASVFKGIAGKMMGSENKVRLMYAAERDDRSEQPLDFSREKFRFLAKQIRQEKARRAALNSELSTIVDSGKKCKM